MTTPPETHVLLIDCADRPGLVHGVTGVLFHAGLNVTRNQEFVDVETSRFFMRTEFAGPAADEAKLLAGVRATLPAGADVRLPSREPRRVVVLASREHHCLADLLVRHSFGELAAEIVGVISNHDTLRGLTEKLGVPFHHAPVTENHPREEQETAVRGLLETLRPDLLVLARYMRVLSPAFVARWPGKIVNIHHSFLPAFAGARPYHQAFRRGVKVIGATAHFVTDELDEGPIIEQQVIPVDHSYGPQSLAQAGRDVERTTLSRALRLVLEDRVFLCGNRTVVFD